MSSIPCDDLDSTVLRIARDSIQEPFFRYDHSDVDFDSAARTFECDEDTQSLMAESKLNIEDDSQYIANIMILLATKPSVRSVGRFIIREGTGYKRGPGKLFGSIWKRRIFCLFDDVLFYAESQESSILGAIPLRGAEIDVKEDEVLILRTKFPRIKKLDKGKESNAAYSIRFAQDFSSWLQILRSTITIANSPEKLSTFRRKHSISSVN